jgi:hypothetical protein
MGRLVACLVVIVTLAALTGCGLGPRNFRKITHPAPLVRARAMSLGYNQPNDMVLPALVSRLDDPDPVVRLAAHEELKRRTGQEFGYLPWASSQERSLAVNRWRAWLNGRPIARDRSPSGPRKSLPAPSPQRN